MTDLELNGRFERLKPQLKIIEAKVDPELHEEIKRYCLLKAQISMKKFARIAVEYYCEQLKKDGEMNGN